MYILYLIKLVWVKVQGFKKMVAVRNIKYNNNIQYNTYINLNVINSYVYRAS